MSDSTTNLTVKEKDGPGNSRLLPHPDSNNIIFFNGVDNQEVMRITPDGRLVKGPGLSDDAASLLFFDSCKKVFGNAADELGDLRAERDSLRAKLAGVRAAVVDACRNAQKKVLLWYPENTRSYIHPNQLAGIYESQVTECLAAIEKVFEESGQQQEDRAS